MYAVAWYNTALTCSNSYFYVFLTIVYYVFDKGAKEPEIETASNATTDTEEEFAYVKEIVLTNRLHQQILQHRPVTVNGQVLLYLMYCSLLYVIVQ